MVIEFFASCARMLGRQQRRHRFILVLGFTGMGTILHNEGGRRGLRLLGNVKHMGITPKSSNQRCKNRHCDYARF